MSHSLIFKGSTHLSDEDRLALAKLMEYPAMRYLFRNIDLDKKWVDYLAYVAQHWDSLENEPEARMALLSEFSDHHTPKSENPPHRTTQGVTINKELEPDLRFFEE